MTPRQIIDKAKERLIDNRELNAVLNRTGSVRVPVLPEAQVTPHDMSVPPGNDTAPVVTFTLEDTVLGRRLMAEFDGRKEFAA